MFEKVNLTEDYQISPVLNGLWQLSRGHNLDKNLDQADVLKAFHQLAEFGMTTFDLADIYIGAEEMLGKFLGELNSHSYLTKYDIQIHEKYVPDKDILGKVTFQDTERIVNRSLQKLDREYIDLMQFHWWDYDVEGYVEAAYNLVKLQEKGKIRHIGVTNFDTDRLKELVDAGIPVVSCQSQYSLFDRRIEKELLDYCQSVDIKHLCFGTLAGGYLSNKYLTNPKKALDTETRSQVKYKQVIEATLGFDGYNQLLELLHVIAKKHQVSVANVATRYILQQEGVIGTIIGTRNSRHVASNQQLFDFHLEDEDLDTLTDFRNQFLDLEGEPYELERTPNSIFQKIIRMNEAEGGS